jgi:uncharacterized protein YciI
MLFIATCIDKPDGLANRMQNRTAHLAYLAKLGARVRAAGALLDPTGRDPIGSLLIFETADEAEVRALLAADPYSAAGLFASVDLKPTRQAVGAPLAG